MDPFLTTYRKDYTRKTVKNLKYLNDINKGKRVEYKEPIAESFKQYLKLDTTTDRTSEEADSYYERAKKKYPWLEEITENKSADKAVVRKDKIFDGRSVYQVVYCDLEEEIAFKEYQRKNAVVLPLDVYIPLTTQKAGFRNPIMLNSRAYEKEYIPRASNNLDPNYKIREILNVTTGDSEYTRVIGKLGENIIATQLHGVINLD